ncbi:hypothetical protein FEMY_20130 [Ferrovum myxofaciens]|uniref:Uncharacterized protein n=1 Tax=Ferrovum myxofaciens TaxID=416213 RepID=A0A149VW57_9PROT|nr:hypothetical protein FEMY_20130 [Ferrovum myxofaciens]
MGDPTIEFQCPDRSIYPVLRRLAGRGTGEGIAGCPQGRHENMGTISSNQGDSRTSKVNEQFLPRAVNLAHGALEGSGKTLVAITELRITVGLAVCIFSPVFFPQQHQGHALAAQFLMNTAKVRLNMLAGTM